MLKTITFAAFGTLLAATSAFANDGKANQQARDDVRMESGAYSIPSGYAAHSTEWYGSDQGRSGSTRNDADVNGN